MDAPQPRISNVFLSVDPFEREYAQTALEVLRSLGIGFVRADPDGEYPSRESLRQTIAGCDAFILVMIQPYGRIPAGERLSHLEVEHEIAVEVGLPVLVYLHQHREPSEGERSQALQAFRRQLMGRHVVSFFSSPADFSHRLTADLQRLAADSQPLTAQRPAPDQAGTEAAPGSGSSPGAEADHDDPHGTPTATIELTEEAFSAGAIYALQAAALWAGSGQTPAAVSTHLLLFALEQLGSLGPETRSAGDFFRQQLGALGAPWYVSREDWLRDHGLAQHMPSPDELQPPAGIGLTPAATRLLDRAGRIAAATSPGDVVAGRHLAAALLTEPAGALEYLSVPRGLPEPALLRDLLFAWMRGYGDRDDEWRRILFGDAPQALHLARFDADDVRGGDLRQRDLLSIERDVLAFATLVGSRALVPPLSIGLFGEWGSGKTFFMRRLRQEVDDLSARARFSGRPQGTLDFYKHVVQIEFNAWQYVEGNLWASLVEHIFRNLHVGGGQGVVEAMQSHWMEKLEFETQALSEANRRKDDAGALVSDAQAKLEQAEEAHREKAKELGELSRQNVERAFVLSGARPAVHGLVRTLGLEPLGTAAGELQASLDQARAVLQRGGAAFTPLLRAPDRRRRRLWLALILFGAPVLGGVIAILLRSLGQDAIGKIAGFATGTAVLLGSLADWLRRQSAWVTEKIARVEEAQQAYDAELAARQAETAREIAERQQELALVREQYTVALQARDEAARRAAQAARELEQATAGRLLARFVEDRAASTDYRKHLGVLAVIRDDFERLSALIEAENARLDTLGDAGAELEGAATRINRIVLYIDDLDRCPPAKVVEVLQAVHLLLAFPLFVVVVGVDARWISRSLESRYRELLHAGAPGEAAELRRTFDMASTGDYLEKIFQVPFWVQPMDAEGSRRLLRRIFSGDRSTPPPDTASARGDRGRDVDFRAPDREPGGAAAAAPAGAAEAREEAGKRVEQEAGGGTEPGAAGPAGTQPRSAGTAKGTGGPMSNRSARSTAGEREEGAVPVPSAESLDIGADESRFVDALAPLLGRSPRALKRFANVYRIMKASLTPAERARFLREDNSRMAGYQCVLFLLAVDTGLPELAPRLFELIMEGAAKQPWKAGDAEPAEDEDARDPARYQRDWLLAELGKAVAPSSPEWEQLRTLSGWLTDYRDKMEEWAAVYRLSRWVPRVSQFSFQPPARSHAPAS